MNFAKLFAAGRGLAGGREMPSPFRVNQRLLPRFNEDRAQRFERTTVPAAPRLDLFADERQATPEPVQIGPRLEEDGHPHLEEIAAEAEPRAEVPPQPTFQQAVRKRRPSRERLEQAELELEQVRVVRNSLEEEDLEFVSPERGKLRPSATRASGTVWGWVSETLFKSRTA